METAPSNAPQASEQQAAPEQQQQQSNQLPTLDDVISSFNDNKDGIEAQTTNPEQPIQDVQQDLEQSESQENKTPEIEQFEQIKRQELEIYKMKKELREEREAFAKERDEQSEGYTGFEETMNELLQSDEERDAKNQEKAFDPDEYKAQLREEILNEVNGQKETEREDQENQRHIDEYVQEARDFTKGRSEDFPILEGMGKHDMVFEAIQATYDENARLYGHEKAGELVPTMEQAAMQVEKSLANELQQVLKSDLVRGYVQKMLSMKQGTPENTTQSNQSHQLQGQNTLTNGTHTHHSAGVKDTSQMTDQEALEYSLSFVTK